MQTTTQMTTTTIRRPYPAKPKKQAPVEYSGIISKENSLSMLRDFYLQAKKEITGATNVCLRSERDYSSLTFKADGFNLELNFTEGREAI